jgi:hypothetical protein
MFLLRFSAITRRLIAPLYLLGSLSLHTFGTLTEPFENSDTGLRLKKDDVVYSPCEKIRLLT